MTLNDNFKQAVEFATEELQGFYDRGNSWDWSAEGYPNEPFYLRKS